MTGKITAALVAAILLGILLFVAHLQFATYGPTPSAGTISAPAAAVCPTPRSVSGWRSSSRNCRKPQRNHRRLAEGRFRGMKTSCHRPR